ncbi:hypothetical protein OJF2_76860 [Aquisphaera giovannonii]|uniref:Uncharacterized protein n=1 Tax=Aquisphaera giovannonii TaxID=406548 RepID=A0A5B9WFQ1_9BACT|nr:hypothetical protein [Aquisphaera giovannonii]QEH39074.1 hypothetical protein OJF2_76860 [Aquisphaera giovannonii]
MAVIARVLGVSLLTGVLAGGLAVALLRPQAQSWDVVVVLFLACVGAVVGAVAGAAREVVSANRPKTSRWAEAR